MSDMDRLIFIENRLNFIEQELLQRDRSASMSDAECRLVRSIAEPAQSYPTEGNTFYAEFIDGSFPYAVGTQIPGFLSRGTNAYVHNLRNVMPPQNTVMIAFHWKEYWWVEYDTGGTSGPPPNGGEGGENTGTMSALNTYNSTDSGANYTISGIGNPGILLRETAATLIRGVGFGCSFPDFSPSEAYIHLTGQPGAPEAVRTYTVKAAVQPAGNPAGFASTLFAPVTTSIPAGSWAPTVPLVIDILSVFNSAVTQWGGSYTGQNVFFFIEPDAPDTAGSQQLIRGFCSSSP